jgi:hypothetical protein
MVCVCVIVCVRLMYADACVHVRVCLSVFDGTLLSKTQGRYIRLMRHHGRGARGKSVRWERGRLESDDLRAASGVSVPEEEADKGVQQLVRGVGPFHPKR